MFQELFKALEETLLMVFSAGSLTWLVGLPLGTLLAITAPQQFLERHLIYKPLSLLISFTRQVPYIALMIALIPFTRWITGSGEGIVAAIIPLTFATIPYFASLCEEAIQEVPSGLVETARAAGASPHQVIYKILIPEALPSIIKGMTQVLIQLISYSTIAGVLGSGGLGSLMVQKASQFYDVLAIMVTLVMITKLIQGCGNYIAHGKTSNIKI